MKFSAAWWIATVLTTSTLAAPLTARRQARNAQREDGLLTDRSTNPPTNRAIGEQNEQYSSNWAGAVLIGNGFKGVSGQFTVPMPQMPSGGSPSTQYCASAWVGIDGDTCERAILQAGVDFCTQNGTPSFSAWYEWFPNFAYDFTNFKISAGDVIQVAVHATSLVTGTASLDNLTTGQSVIHTFTFPGLQSPLCEQNAEWIIEDFLQNGSQVPFANFGNVTFSNAQATDNGATVGTTGATIYDIRQNGKVLTHSTDTVNSVAIQYVG